MSSSTGDPTPLAPYGTGATAVGSTDRDVFTTATTGTTSTGSSSGPGAEEQAAGVASDAGDAGKHVAGVARDQAKDVVGEARRQATDLLGQGRAQLTEQSSAGQQRAASGLSALAQELKDLAEGKGGSGVATDLAHQASQRVDAVGSWLSDREPADVLREVQSFARRRPVAFLAIAAGVGLVAGRLTRGVAAVSHEESAEGGTTTTPPPAAAVPVVPVVDRDFDADAPLDVDADRRYTGTADPLLGSATTTGVRGEQGWDGPLR